MSMKVERLPSDVEQLARILSDEKPKMRPCVIGTRQLREVSKFGSRLELEVNLIRQFNSLEKMMNERRAAREINYRKVSVMKSSLKMLVCMLRLYWTIVSDEYDFAKQNTPSYMKWKKKRQAAYREGRIPTIEEVRKSYNKELKTIPIMSRGIAKDLAVPDDIKYKKKGKVTRMRNKLSNNKTEKK